MEVLANCEQLPRRLWSRDSSMFQILDLLERFGVTAVFTGHWHANNIVQYYDTQLITSGPITYSLGKDPSGIRVLEIDVSKLTQEYIAI